jgi:hypothetical protein
VVDLAWWLAPTLWEVELAEPVSPSRHKLTARKGRLVAPVEEYPAAARELAEACAWRARDRAVDALRGVADDLAADFARAASLDELRALADASDDSTAAGTAAALASDAAELAAGGPITESPFIAACAAGHAAAGLDGDQVVFDTAYADERAWQSVWLSDRLGLRPD